MSGGDQGVQSDGAGGDVCPGKDSGRLPGLVLQVLHSSHVTCHMSHASYVTYLLRAKCDGLHAPHVSDIELTNHRVACHMCYKHYMSHMLHMLHVTCNVSILCCQGGLYDMTHFTGHPGGVGRLQMAAGNDLEVCRGGS